MGVGGGDAEGENDEIGLEGEHYSCESAADTLRWIEAIVEFLRGFPWLTEAHLVNFFKDRLWEALDHPDWIHCLANDPLHNLLRIPSGLIQDHWPASLKHFLLTLKSLLFPRHHHQLQLQLQLQTVFPGFTVSSLNSVLSQGMNPKKKHEVQLLSAVVSSVANSVGAHKIFDVGAGQGYLSQVLSFHYHHSVVAIDASPHHGRVTNARAERIKRHYASQMHKSKSGNRSLVVPKTITCHVMSIDMLRDMTCSARYNDLTEQGHENGDTEQQKYLCHADSENSVVLAGLHACGDLSVMMLKAFLACKEVKAVVSIGCCYNLLSEEGIDKVDSQYGFPVSQGVKSAGFSLGRSLRDLACQSAERWNCLETDAGIDNFELHAFRAAFQMILNKYYPEVIVTSPSIGRQGKALRRLQKKGMLESLPPHEECACGSSCHMRSKIERKYPSVQNTELETDGSYISTFEAASSSSSDSLKGSSECDLFKSDKFTLFQRYCHSGLRHLGLKPLQEIDYFTTWREVEPFSELIGPYWSLRAALGPLIETFILLDRLLLLKEQGDSIEALMLPVFDPAVSPRNVAIIAKKIDRNVTQ